MTNETGKRLFAVTLSTTAIVEAADEDEALEVARDEQRDICGDHDLDRNLIGEVTSIADVLSHGWDERCIPYGGDGNTTLGEILSSALPA
jgi:hypothetical protein